MPKIELTPYECSIIVDALDAIWRETRDDEDRLVLHEDVDELMGRLNNAVARYAPVAATMIRREMGVAAPSSAPKDDSDTRIADAVKIARGGDPWPEI